MTYVTNPLYTGGNDGGAGAIRAAESLGKALFGGGDPMEQAKAMVLGAQGRQYKSQAMLNEDQLDARQGFQSGLGSLFDEKGNYLPDARRRLMTEVLPIAARIDPQAADELVGIASAFSGDDSLARAGMIGRGITPGENFAIDMGRADSISRRDASEDTGRALAVQGLQNKGAMERELVKPLTFDQLKARELQNLEAANPGTLSDIFLEGLAGSTQPRQVNLPDGKTAIAIGTRYRDAEGNLVPIPMGSQVFSTTAMPTSGEGLKGLVGLSKTNETDMQKYVMKRQRASEIGRRIIDEISPNSQGLVPSLLDTPAVGIARQLAPEAVDAATEQFGYNIPDAQVSRNAMYRGVQQVREQLMNEDGKLSDRDQALVDQLGMISRMEVDSETAKRAWEQAISDWESEAVSGYETLTTGIEAPVKTPVVGEIVPGDDGDYRFLGGDPNDQTNYEKVE